MSDKNDSILIDLKNISKSFEDTDGESNLVLNDISLSVKKNTFVTLLGPSGCGKTTLLRIIGGFEIPTAGSVLFEGRDIASIPPYKRPL
ncbi:MAG: ATP-binding cassette domain-containing protein, partial [Firmicutes bacterium]|nr:ATP-binding cassette domain-containing protein [Bacillota bacterium]